MRPLRGSGSLTLLTGLLIFSLVPPARAHRSPAPNDPPPSNAEVERSPDDLEPVASQNDAPSLEPRVGEPPEASLEREGSSHATPQTTVEASGDKATVVDPEHDDTVTAETSNSEPLVDDTVAAETSNNETMVDTQDDTVAAETSNDETMVDTQDDTIAVAAQKPPRIDGPYVGGTFFGSVGAVRVNDLGTPGAFAGWGGYLRFGQMVLPWLGIGLQLGGSSNHRAQTSPRQTANQGALMLDFTFVPLPKRLNLSLRGSFGFGAGAVTEDGVDGRSGFGGAYFGVAGRYEFFPGANKYRATRGGGFGIGPEIGWLGATPAARGRPMSNLFYVGLSSTWYFGD